MRDTFGREIRYLRLSITTRCNLDCVYCGKAACEKRATELSPDELGRIARAFAACGIERVRITGGEPLVRADVCEIVRVVRQNGDFSRVSLTTNGVLLADCAEKLAQAGLTDVNVSLDSTDHHVYRKLTGSDALRRVLDGIDSARDAGLSPIKINAVLMRGVNDDGAEALVDLARREPIDVRFIELMPFADPAETARLRVTGEELLSRFPFLEPVGALEGTARYYKAPGFAGRVGLISPVTRKFCADCDRIRVLSDGCVKPCLGFDETFDLKPWLSDPAALEQAARDAILRKPAGHDFTAHAPRPGLNNTGG